MHCHAYYKWIWKPAWIDRSKKKILFGACQCDGYNGKSEGIAYLKMQGLPRSGISLVVVIHIMGFGHQLFGVRLWVLVCQDTSSSRTFLGLWRDCVGRLVGLRSEFDLVETIVWCSLVRLFYCSCKRTATSLFVRPLVLSCQPLTAAVCWNLADSAARCKLSPPVLLYNKIQGPVTKYTSPDYVTTLQHIRKTKLSLEKNSFC